MPGTVDLYYGPVKRMVDFLSFKEEELGEHLRIGREGEADLEDFFPSDNRYEEWKKSGGFCRAEMFIYPELRHHPAELREMFRQQMGSVFAFTKEKGMGHDHRVIFVTTSPTICYQMKEHLTAAKIYSYTQDLDTFDFRSKEEKQQDPRLRPIYPIFPSQVRVFLSSPETTWDNEFPIDEEVGLYDFSVFENITDRQGETFSNMQIKLRNLHLGNK